MPVPALARVRPVVRQPQRPENGERRARRRSVTLRIDEAGVATVDVQVTVSALSTAQGTSSWRASAGCTPAAR